MKFVSKYVFSKLATTIKKSFQKVVKVVKKLSKIGKKVGSKVVKSCQKFRRTYKKKVICTEKKKKNWKKIGIP
jgi:uncharacterized protein YqgV (UPF0045/DUF77 family)